MIDRYLLRIVVVLSFLLGLFSPGLEAQEREEVYPKELLNVIMRGAGDPPALPSLDASYCSDDGPIDIYVEETLPANVTTIQWTVQFNMGGTLVAVSDYHESIGSLPNLGIRLFPDRFSEEHLNRSILISYNIVSGTGSSGKGDYTHVLKKPTVYNLSIDGFEAEVDGEICIGESVTLILDGSEVGVNYFLQRDGVNINPFPQEGTGGALSWTNISVGGEYSVLAVNSRSFQFGPDVTHSYQCSSVMNETPLLTVHPLPVPTANSDKSTYCVGEPIQLSGGPDDMVSYSWTYPDGAIAEERNPLIASADYSSHNGTYTLTVESADGCINTTTLKVVVNENPTATLPADFDVCEDAPLNFTTTVTGGAGPYSYAWTKDGNPIGTTTANISIPGASLGDAGIYEVTVTDANGCGAATASISIGVNERPVIGAVSNDGPACEGESIQLSSSGVTGVGILSYAWTGPNDYSSSDENPLIDPVTLADVGAYTLVVSDESGCSSDPATTTVVVDALPEATLSGDAAVCVGATGSYTAGGGDQYTFTVLDASNTTVESHGPSASNTFETSALAVGSYTIQVLVENAAGCTAEESVTLTVNAAPEATIAFDPAVICEGESSELVVELTTGAAPWSLSYNDGSGVASRSGITGLTHREEVNHTSKVTYTLLSITANGCTVNPNTTATLTVNERPKVSVESDNDPSNEVCLGGTMVLTATASDGVAPYGYQWYFEGNPISGATGVTYSISNAEAADAGAYSVVVSSSNAGVTCDSDPASLTVTVVEVTAALDGAAGYCFGGTETYTASGGDSYTFTLYDAGNIEIATQAASANANYTTSAALAAGDYTLEVVVANVLGCDDVATLSFTIHPEPVANISFSEPVVCEGDNTTLEIELTSGSTPWSVTYDNGLGDQTVNGITETSFSLEFSPTGDVTYTLVSITDANGCTATPGTTAEVTVNEVPTVGLLSDNDPSNLVCLGNDMLLRATASGGAGNYVYQWTHNGVVLPGATGATYTISNAEITDAGEYSVVVTDTDNGHACESAPASLTVVVTEAVAGLSGSGEICAGTSEEYTATGGSSYLFELLDAADAVIDTRVWNIDATYSTDLALAVGTYTLRVTVEDANGCQAQSQLPIEVKESPNNTLTYSATDICSGESITVTAVSGYSTYIFYVNGDEVQNGPDHEYTSSTFVDGDVVKAEIILGACSTESAEQTISVRPLPVVELVSDQPDNVACPGETVELTASGAVQYAFELNGVEVQALSAIATYSAVFNHGDEIIVYGEAANGCVSSDTLRISVNTPVATLELSSAELCVNEALTLTAGGGVQYEFFRNGVSLGAAGSASTFEVSDPADGDEFSVTVINQYGCEASANAPAVVVHDLPTLTLSSDHSEFCSDTEVTFTAGGGNVFAFYRERGGIVGLVQESSSSTYSASDFEDGDQVFVVVTDANDCSATSSSIALTVWPLPEAGITVSPQYAGEGDDVTITGEGGEDYLFLVNGEPYDGDFDGWIAGPLTLNTLVNGDELSVIARNEFGCVAESETITMTIDAYPIEFDLLPVYPEYCENDGGATLYLKEPEPLTNVEYELFEVDADDNFIGPAGINPVEEAGELVWNLVPEGRYRLKARRLPGGLEKEFAAVAEVKMIPNPAVFDLVAVENEDPTICEVTISLSGSELGVYYYLQLDGDNLLNDPLEGTGSALDFGPFSFGGTYSILAVSPNGCTTEMNNSYSKDVTPNSALFTVSSDPADGFYCEGSEGVTLQTDGSEDEAAYQIYFYESPLGESVLGTGAALSFGPYTNEGVYRVVIAGDGGCLYVLDDAITVSEIPLPDPVALSAEYDGHFCEGDTEGVELTQTGFEAGVSYALYFEGVLVDGKEWTASSTDMSGSHSYGDFSQAGTYTIQGTTILGGCSQQVAEIELVADPLPTAFEVKGEGFYCGPTGKTFITLSGSETSVSYQLMLNNDVEVGTPQPGTGLPLSFEVNVEGVYTVLASRSDVFTTCSRIMTGDVAVVMRDLPDTDIDVAPIDYNDADCTTGVTIELESSQAGVLYELYFVDNGTYISTGNTVYGDENGGPVQFPNPVIDGGGEYIVQATLDGCPADIEPKFEIDIDDVPRRFALIGSGDVCEGEDGADLWLSGSEDDVSYELWARHGVSPVQTVTFPHADFDTGEAFPFNKVVEEGAYYVRAVSGNDASCAVTTYEDLEVRFHKLPDSYQFTGTQFFCGTAEGEGAVLKLNDSEAGVVYSLMRRVAGDFTLFVESKDGNDGPLEFSEVFTEGIYRAYARDTLTGCTSSMNGTVEVEHRDAPGDFELISSVGTVNDGDVLDICYGDNSFSLMVSNSQPGVLYRLYRENNDGEKQLRATVEGNGEVVHFNNEVQWPRGTYFVEPTFASTACVGPMVEFFIEFLYGPHDNHDRPLIIDNIGGRIKVRYPGPALTTYVLYMGNERIESFITNEPFQEVVWTVNDPGNYHVEAYSEDRPACINKSNTISISAPYSLVDQVLEYCSGDAGGIDVVLTGTTAGAYYELVKLDDHDNPEVIQIKKGITGVDSLVFNGVEGTHRYSIWVDGSDEDFKIDTDDKTFVVTENTTPTSFLLSRGGAVNSHEITLSESEEGVWYWLIRNGNFDFEEMPLVGTDSILNFGTVNKPGDYFVIAFGEGGCEAEMEGMANIYQSELVAVNDTLYLSPDDLAGTLDLAENDRFSFIGGLDRYSTAGDGNLMFRIVRPAKSGAETSLNEFSGMLSYSKLPSFYGEDFLEYRIENLDVPGRESGIGRVVIMVGNKDFNENQSFLLPNAFSPNGDGTNDRFVISGLGETEESTLEVFNRWGTIVYRSQGKQYDNSWDGTSNVGAMVSIGKELPNGVYFYVYSVKKNVNGSIQTRNYSGYVELRR